MKTIKILHSADFHFDTPFKEIGERQSKLNKEEIKEVFSEIINISKNNCVDILLLAGDIFDNNTVNKNTLYFIEEKLKEIPNIKVFISPGNHDPFSKNSFYNFINWPENVYVFNSGIEKVYLKDLDINIWGAAFNEKYVRTSMLRNVRAEDGKINIMVLHGEVVNSSEENEYNPITLNDILESNMDYIALGHRHAYSGIKKIGNTFYAYSGCPQGRGFDELGDKGVICGDISKGVVDLKFIKTSKRRYEQVKIDVTDCYTHEEIKSLIKATIEEDSKENLYKVILIGEVSEEFNIDEDILSEQLSSDFYFIKVIDKTKVKVNLEEISKGYSVKAIFASKISKLINESTEESEKEILMKALKIGLSSLSEDEVSLDDY
ncbi:MAG: DNA repair exonuclease [Clostridium sp.]|nr:DNA repair exonuclease [Clostridium sp.]